MCEHGSVEGSCPLCDPAVARRLHEKLLGPLVSRGTTEALKSVDEALRSRGLPMMTLREGLIARAILAAVELAREEIRAPVQPESKPVEAPATVVVDGLKDASIPDIEYMGVATRQPNGKYHCHAVVGSRLCVVEVSLRPDPNAAQPPAPVQPVAPRELTYEEAMEIAKAWMADDSFFRWSAIGDAPRRDRVELVRAVARGDVTAVTDEFVTFVKSRLPPAVPQPAPSENGDTSLAYACGAVAAAAVAIVDPTQPSDVVFRVVRDALAANGATQPAPDSWHDAVTWIEGWGTEQPAPSATVDEVIDAIGAVSS